MPSPLAPDEPTVAWDLAKVLLVASVAALLVAAWFALRPVENPGVQDCGAPLRFVASSEQDVVVPIGVQGAPPDAPALRAQEPCSSLVVAPLERAGLFTAAGVLLGLLGAVLGLIDDRVRLRRATPFQSLVRPRPADAPGRPLDPVPTRPEELAVGLPAIEPGELVLLGLAAALTFVGLPLLVGAADVGGAVSDVSVGAVLLLAGLAAAARVAAALTRAAGLDPASPLAREGSGGTTQVRRWLRLAVASGWLARARPETGVHGLDAHELARHGGLGPQAAADRAGGHLGVAVAVHAAVVVLGLLVVGAPAVSEPDARAYLLLVGAVAVGVLLGLGRAPRVLRAQAVLPGRAAWRTIRREQAPAQVAVLAVGALGQLALDGAVVAVMAGAVGGPLAVSTVVLAWAVAATVGAASPLPAGSGLTEAALALVLWRWGMGGGEAVAVALVARAVTFWLPLGAGWWAGRPWTTPRPESTPVEVR